MKIEFKMAGGFAAIPGLSKPLLFDTEQIAEATEKEKVEALIQDANFFGPAPIAAHAAPGRADHQQYTITVEKDDLRHTVQLSDPIRDPHFQDLITYLRAKARAALISS